jgi:hypothetical protein
LVDTSSVIPSSAYWLRLSPLCRQNRFSGPQAKFFTIMNKTFLFHRRFVIFFVLLQKYQTEVCVRKRFTWTINSTMGVNQDGCCQQQGDPKF